jgi:hypothetical protein
MRKILLMFALALSAGALPVTAGAHGCIKGAEAARAQAAMQPGPAELSAPH